MPFGLSWSVKLVGNLLIAASALFFLESAFEMYFLTFTLGHQQMLGFSLVHIAPQWLFTSILISGAAFLVLAMFALALQILRLTGRLRVLDRYSKFMLIVLCVQIVHGLLLITYNRWAGALFPLTVIS